MKKEENRLGPVRMKVIQGGELMLDYHCVSLAQAAEIMEFLRDFLPEAEFDVGPVLH